VDWQAVAPDVARMPEREGGSGVRVACHRRARDSARADAGAGGRRADGRFKAEAIEARNWTYFPPLGRRSNGGGQAFDANMWGGVPGGYRNTINDNVVLIEMIETLEGPQGRRRSRRCPA
jgi:2-keto-3-deoxy-L-rhamnonate aldolase RhmA